MTAASDVLSAAQCKIKILFVVVSTCVALICACQCSVNGYLNFVKVLASRLHYTFSFRFFHVISLACQSLFP